MGHPPTPPPEQVIGMCCPADRGTIYFEAILALLRNCCGYLLQKEKLRVVCSPKKRFFSGN